ncbi:MAG: hypothetical protein ABIE14_02575 [Patescibacteria group bacterium]
MKKTFFIVLASFLLFGCVQNQKSNLLEKNKECFKYWDTIEKDLTEKFSTLELRAMFYSPKVDSCVFESRQHFGEQMGCGISDVFTREVYEEIRDADFSDCDELKEKFIKNLK